MIIYFGESEIAMRKPIVSIFAALDEKRGIGKDNKIPWHIKEDLVRLKNLTTGHVTIIGRKTYESMDGYYRKSGNQMPGELYVIVTRDKTYATDRENATTVESLEEAMNLARDEEQEEIVIIGGGQIFKEAMEKDLVDILHLTVVEGNYDADTFFPDYSEFGKVLSEEEGQSGEYKFKFLDLGKS